MSPDAEIDRRLSGGELKKDIVFKIPFEVAEESLLRG